MFFCPDSRYCLILASPSFMPATTAAFCSCERIARSNFFPASTPRRASFFSDFLLLRFGGSELQREGEVVKEAGLNQGRISLGEVDGRRHRRRGLFQILGERLNFVASLDLDYVRHVLRVKELGAVGHRRELRARLEDLLDAWRRLAFPV